MKQYEKFRKSVESTELESAHLKQSIEREYFDRTSKEHRESTRQRMESAISKGGYWTQYTLAAGAPGHVIHPHAATIGQAILVIGRAHHQ